MQSGFKHSSHGFSLVEMLVVIALIGVLSLISVPAFINFRNSNTFRADLRTFTADLRSARQYAISNSMYVRVELDQPLTANPSKNYRFFKSSGPCEDTLCATATWTTLSMPGATANVKRLDPPVWFDSTSALADIGANSKPDIIYHPNGSMTIDTSGGATAGTVVLRCIWKRIAF